jgi:replicative DNA helicase
MIQHELLVIIFSLEMTKHQSEYRLWSLMSHLNCYQYLDLTTINSDRLQNENVNVVDRQNLKLHAFADCFVEAPQNLTESMTNATFDRHVVATAIASNAS